MWFGKGSTTVSDVDRARSVEIAAEAFGGPVEWARERQAYAA